MVRLRDLERVRGHLTLPALGRVRLIIEALDGKLSVQMECISCEELLECDSKKGWWACPSCHQETTEHEAGDLFGECHKALGIVLGDRTTDAGGGSGRWLDRLREMVR